MTTGTEQLLSERRMYLPRLEQEMPTKRGFNPQGNSSTCVTETRCETPRKISEAYMSITTTCTHCFLNVFISISVSVNRSASSRSLLLTSFIFSGSLSLTQRESGAPELGTHMHVNELAGLAGDGGHIWWDLFCTASENEAETLTQH